MATAGILLLGGKVFEYFRRADEEFQLRQVLKMVLEYFEEAMKKFD